MHTAEDTAMSRMGGGQAGSMPEWQRKILRDNRKVLAHDLEVNEILNHMIQENILTRQMQENIRSKQIPAEKTETFLDLLPKRGENAFWTFLKALKETHEHLYEMIQKGIDEETKRDAHESEIYEDLDFSTVDFKEYRTEGPPSQFEYPQSYITPIVSHQGDSSAHNREVNPTVEVITDVTGEVVEEYNKDGRYMYVRFKE